MIGIPLGFVVANGIEWATHRYVLHGLGKRRDSFWSFHWAEHHSACRRQAFRDADYERSPLAWNAQGKEVAALAAAGVALAPLAVVAPFFYGTLVYCGVDYWRKHRRSHLDPEWAREHLPWHYDHHMAPWQDANWCVTRPWFDHIMGTRRPWLGTPAEAEATARRARAQAS